MILIFDVEGGLCNQIYQIGYALDFCQKHTLQFTFRYCKFRNSDLRTFSNMPFNALFDLEFLKNYPLYIAFEEIQNKLNPENTFNFDRKIRSNLYFTQTTPLIDQIHSIQKEYGIFKEFWGASISKHGPSLFIIKSILPTKKIVNLFHEQKKKLFPNPQRYNYLHYRYESDFIKHFKIEIESLDSVIKNNRSKYSNPNLKLFIATSNIKHLINISDPKYNDIIFKNDDDMVHLNYEERAYIDYLFGVESEQVIGHSKSSFTRLLQFHKKDCSNLFYM